MSGLPPAAQGAGGACNDDLQVDGVTTAPWQNLARFCQWKARDKCSLMEGTIVEGIFNAFEDLLQLFWPVQAID